MPIKGFKHPFKSIWCIPAVVVGKNDNVSVRFLQQSITGDGHPLGGQQYTIYGQTRIARQQFIQKAWGVLIGQKNSKFFVGLPFKRRKQTVKFTDPPQRCHKQIYGWDIRQRR